MPLQFLIGFLQNTGLWQMSTLEVILNHSVSFRLSFSKSRLCSTSVNLTILFIDSNWDLCQPFLLPPMERLKTSLKTKDGILPGQRVYCWRAQRSRRKLTLLGGYAAQRKYKGIAYHCMPDRPDSFASICISHQFNANFVDSDCFHSEICAFLIILTIFRRSVKALRMK